MVHTSLSRIRTSLLLIAALVEAPFAQAQIPSPPDAPVPVDTQSTAPQQALTPVPLAHPPTTEDEGDALLARQRYQAAIDAYQRIPNPNAALWNKMGIAYQLLLDSTDAQRCYEKARKLEPRNPTVLNNLGSLAMADRHYATAERFYRKAVKYEPHNALYAKNLGTAYLADKHYKEGWQAYQSALAIDPNIFSGTGGLRVQNPSSPQERGALNFYMAKGCLLAGKPQQAIEYLRLALNEGFITPKKLIEDNEFASLHNLPEFQQLMAANEPRLEHR